MIRESEFSAVASPDTPQVANEIVDVVVKKRVVRARVRRERKPAKVKHSTPEIAPEISVSEEDISLDEKKPADVEQILDFAGISSEQPGDDVALATDQDSHLLEVSGETVIPEATDSTRENVHDPVVFSETVAPAIPMDTSGTEHPVDERERTAVQIEPEAQALMDTYGVKSTFDAMTGMIWFDTDHDGVRSSTEVQFHIPFKVQHVKCGAGDRLIIEGQDQDGSDLYAEFVPTTDGILEPVE